VIDDLAEVHHGRFAGLTNAEIEASHPGELRRRERQKYTWTFPGGESYADADTRAGRALDHVAASTAQAALLITHEMIGRMLLRWLLDLMPADAMARSIPHGTVIEVHPGDGQMTSHPIARPE
jgi:probable phosphoglycerate mutase